MGESGASGQAAAAVMQGGAALSPTSTGGGRLSLLMDVLVRRLVESAVIPPR